MEKISGGNKDRINKAITGQVSAVCETNTDSFTKLCQRMLGMNLNRGL